MTDLVAFGETMLRLTPPGDGRLETARTFDVQAAGAESNAAIAAGRLGAEVVLLSKVPDSPLGHRAVNELREQGIEPAVVWSDEGRQGLAFLEHGGAPRGTRVHYDRSNAAVTTATTEELPTGLLGEASVFLTSGVTPALSNRLAETTADLLSTAAQAGTKTAFSLRYRPKLWSHDRARAMLTKLFPAVDTLVTTADDARTVFDLDDAPQRMAHHLASKWEFDTVIVTRDDWSAVALHGGVIHDEPAVEAETADAVGTGDAFVGGFLARRIAGEDVPTALRHAIATAALKRTVPGDVATVTLAEVREVVEAMQRRDRSR